MSKIKDAGGALLGVLFFIIIITIPILFIWGSVALGMVIIQWLSILSWIVLAIDIIILLPLCIFPATRTFAGTGLFISSFIYGITLWFLGLLFTYILWGMFGVIIGLFIAGVGVVPFGILATLFNGLWGGFWTLIILAVLTFGTRIFGLMLADS